jgi:phosphohistidine phosphatase SixA
MKSLTLFRHAKTDRDSTSGRDFDRRLILRGQDDSKRMGVEFR